MEVTSFLACVSMLIALFDLGKSLECYVCHSRQSPECSDPFPMGGNKTGSALPYNCTRVRNIGMGAVAAASSALGTVPSSFTPLQTPPHVCFKITVGDFAIRGCGKSDVCQNFTESCEICDTDGCNAGSRYRITHLAALLPIISAFFN